MVGERAAHDSFVGPGGAEHDRHRAIRAENRRELGDERSSAWIDRWIASVAPVAAKAASVSLSGMAEARPLVRVSTSDCATSGKVSSRCSAAALAAKAGTPGVTS